MRKAIFFLLLTLYTVSCSNNCFLVETESFSQKGGWVVDYQAFVKIHSSYLLAHGHGTPVEDAVTSVSVPSPGTYYVYASTYNWTSPWYDGEGPGAFRIIVDGRTLPEILGTKGDSWGWQYAGSVELNSDTAEVTLRDLTGFEGRVDAIYFSKKKEAPSRDYLSLDSSRLKWGGIDGQHEVESADLVVVGGGVSGCATALTAARYGLDVVLIDNQPWLGGNAQMGVRNGGVCFKNLYPKLGRLTFEMIGIDPDLKDTLTPYNYFESSGGGGLKVAAFGDGLRKPVTETGRSSDILDAARRVQASGVTMTDSLEIAEVTEEYIRKNSALNTERLLKEAGVRIFQNINVYKVDRQGDMVSRVTGRDVNTGEEYVFSGTLFSDNTGDGVVGYLAGADFMIGREGKDFAREPSAPEQADQKKMGSTLWWLAFPRADSGVFPKPAEIPWAIQLDSTYHVKANRYDWWWETGLEIDNALETELVRDNMFRAIYGNWAYLKNYDSDYAGYRLDYVQHLAMKRESRRLIGDLILTECDIMDHKEYEDASFTATWTLDLHYAQKENTERFPGWEWLTYCTGIKVDRYHVPYRCLYSRNIENLFIGGRCISVSHQALGTTRLQLTLGMAGEVTGMAARICKDHGSLPRSVYTDYMDELKNYMEAGIPDTK